MHLFDLGVFEQQDETARVMREQAGRGQAGKRLLLAAGQILKALLPSMSA
jgi:hypothetical protein